MALGDYRILPGLVTEEIGQEILVCDTDLAVVHRVSGPAADVLRQVLANRGAPAALESDDITSGLVTAGVLVSADAPADDVTRRSFVRAAAAVGAMGIVTLALPRAAAASSGNVDGFNSSATPLVFVSVDPDNTGIDYPGFAANENDDVRTVALRWVEKTAATGGGPFAFNVRITGSNSPDSFVPFTLTGLPSSPRAPATRVETQVTIPGWEAGESLTVDFVTRNVDPRVSGSSRFQLRGN